MFSTESSQKCQSRYFKEWHPDYIGSYNSLNDRHLKRFFQNPARRNHLNRNYQVSPDGRAVSEREWRKQNLEWERRRREAEESAERVHQRDVDERRARMVLRQQQKDRDSQQRRRERREEEERQRQEEEDGGSGPGGGGGEGARAIKEAWTDQAALLEKISRSNRGDVEQLLNFLNFEIEYILRPRSAPLRYRGAPRLFTDRRAQSARRGGGGGNHHHQQQYYSSRDVRASYGYSGWYGYPQVRTKSLERRSQHQHHASTPEIQFGDATGDESAGSGKSPIRNIEIPELGFSPDSSGVGGGRRPATAPSSDANNNDGVEMSSSSRRRRRRSRRRPHSSVRPRSPSHPNYKEDAYLLTHVRLQYVGHLGSDDGTLSSAGDGDRSRRRRRRRSGRRSCGRSSQPTQIDEVTIVQQPRGSYVLEVFHGFLAVGDTFHFTSRRVDGYPFSLTIYVNRQCHMRLSTCCESKRAAGTRLGQGNFQLMELTGAIPCIRCILDKDPIAQKHSARINKLRGTYDRYGNRIPPDFIGQKKTKRWKKKSDNRGALESDEEEEDDDDVRLLHSPETQVNRRRRTPPRNIKKKKKPTTTARQQPPAAAAVRPTPSPQVTRRHRGGVSPRSGGAKVAPAAAGREAAPRPGRLPPAPLPPRRRTAPSRRPSTSPPAGGTRTRRRWPCRR